ncbi:MAG TPA: recombinase family protein [Gemmatimonadales bacterium]
MPNEVEWVRFLDGAYLETRSLDKVAKLAYRRGIRSRNGRTLTKDAVCRILRNPVYVGLISYNGDTFKGSHEPIRDKKTYNRIVESLERNRRHKGNGTSKAKQYEYLLQGLILCGYCSGKMVPRRAWAEAAAPTTTTSAAGPIRPPASTASRTTWTPWRRTVTSSEYVKQLALRDEFQSAECRT